MTNPLIRGLTGIGRFSGRDRRGRFWPYAATVIVSVFVLGGAGMAWSMQGIFAQMQSFATAHPEAATVQSSPGSYSISIDPTHPDAPTMDFSGFFSVLAIVVLIAVVLLAAAVSRRLHDTGKPAYLGLAPVLFLTLGLCLLPVLMSDFDNPAGPNMGLFLALILNNFAYLASLAALVFQLVRKSVAGPNRYGPEPI